LETGSHIVLESDVLEGASRSVPNAFLGGHATIPNNPLIASALAAILKGGPKAAGLLRGWSETPEGRLVYRHAGRKRGEITVYADLRADDRAPPASLADQWAYVRSLSPLTADILIMILAQLCDPSQRGRAMYPALSPVKVTVNRLLGYKRYSRWGAERAQFRASFADDIGRLQKLRFDVREYPGWDNSTARWNAGGLDVLGDRIFEVANSGERYCTEREDRLLEAAWSIRAGHWAGWWLNTRGTVWTSTVPKPLLMLDHRRNRGIELLAKKIGLHMLLLWGAARSRYAFFRRVDHLLEDIGELVAPEQRDSHWAGRIRDRLDEALLRLQEGGIFAEVSWPNGRGPGDLDRGKGWVDHWLASIVRICRPGGPIAGVSGGEKVEPARRRRRRKRTAKAPPTLLGSEIRALRTGREMSLLSLAAEMGILTSYLSQIESGKRAVNENVVQRLRPWIGPSEAGRTINREESMRGRR
jgi:DNA-binding transcriptional regulator YiaG